MREHAAPGRPREFDPDEKLEAIMNLFWEKGYEGASLSNIVAATSLKKGSLYKAFGDKRAMYLKALARYQEKAVGAAVAMLRGDGPPKERLEAFLSVPIDAAWRDGDIRGCFLCNAATDQAADDPEIAKIVRNGFDRMARALETPLSDIDMDVPSETVEAWAALILSVYAGLRSMARAGTPRAQLTAARDAALQSLGPN